jgi:hypothetical protein
MRHISTIQFNLHHFNAIWSFCKKIRPEFVRLRLISRVRERARFGSILLMRACEWHFEQLLGQGRLFKNHAALRRIMMRCDLARE